MTIWDPPLPEDKTAAGNPDTQRLGQIGHTREQREAQALRNGELISHLKDPAAIKTAFRNIDRAVKTDWNDRALRTLYLSYGMLDWTQEGEAYQAPLIYIPMELKKVRGQYRIGRSDDDPIINPPRSPSGYVP